MSAQLIRCFSEVGHTGDICTADVGTCYGFRLLCITPLLESSFLAHQAAGVFLGGEGRTEQNLKGTEQLIRSLP